MTDYRRAYIPRATWFFTVNLAERRGNRLLIEKNRFIALGLRLYPATASVAQMERNGIRDD
jgi:hypothetical protein